MRRNRKRKMDERREDKEQKKKRIGSRTERYGRGREKMRWDSE